MVTQVETATQIWTYLKNGGWTEESIAAVLGNMQSESGIIADRWESDIQGNMDRGYGLVQWTPATKYIDWAKQNGLIYQEVISQCKRLEWEVANNKQFSHPTMTFKQFVQSKQSPEVLADLFIRYYERPLNPNQPARQTQARYWFEALKGVTGRIQLKRYTVGWNVGKDFKRIQEYRMNINATMKVDFSDITYHQDVNLEWHIGITNQEFMRTPISVDKGVQEYRLDIMNRYKLKSEQIEITEFLTEALKVGYKGLTLAEFQHIRLRFIQKYGNENLQLVETSKNIFSAYVVNQSLRQVQHLRIRMNNDNQDMNISDKRDYTYM